MNRQTPKAIIRGGFWKTYQDLVRDKVIPYQWKAMNDEIPGAPKSHSVENFRIAAGRSSGTHEGMVFQDSDLYKWLEAVGNILSQGAEATEGTVAMRAWADEAVALIAAAQQPDGYINTYFTVNEPGQRFGNLRDAHELYCSGHLIEAGVALFRGTGNKEILAVVRKLADYIDSRFGIEPGKIRGYPGHEEIELALMKLARITGEMRYLRRAQYFIDERGTTPNFFELEALRPDFKSIFGAKPLPYYQAHQPVRDQVEAVGHAVRAMYLYIAMADLACETGEASLVKACDRLWDDVTGRKMYVTGSVGSSAVYESFSAAFDLPNDTAYAETCAAIGLFLFSSRMARLHDEARYADVMERCLYNGVLSGLSLDGESYFYVNPLEVDPDIIDANASLRSVKYRRQSWYGCACCPPNIARTLSSLGDHLYHQNDTTLFVDLYHEGTLSFAFGGANVVVHQKTAYPWSGEVTFEVQPLTPTAFTLALRQPAWCTGARLRLNGQSYAAQLGRNGYLTVQRVWQQGDRVDLELPMKIQRIHADPRVRATNGKVAIQRGPLLYCLEVADNGTDLFRVILSPEATLEVLERPDLLGGIKAIGGIGHVAAVSEPAGGLYGEGARKLPQSQHPLVFIPYFSWANRQRGAMIVWVRENP